MSSSERFTEAYVEYAKEFTDAPEIFHRYVAYWLISCVVNRQVYLPQGNQNYYPNLWVLLLAPSSFYRKSYSLFIGEQLLESVKPGFVWPNEFSHESLVSTFHDRPIGTFVYDEFSSLLSIFRRSYSEGTQTLMTTLYGYNGTYVRKVGIGDKAKEMAIEKPFLNMLTASTIAWIKKYVRYGDVTGGFLPRMLVVPGPKREKLMAWQPLADKDKFNRLVLLLSGISQVAGEVKYSPEAKEAYTQWVNKLVPMAEQEDDKIQPFMARTMNHIHKLTTIICLDRHEFPVVTTETFDEARMELEYLMGQVKDLVLEELEDNPRMANVAKIKKLLSKNGDMSHSNLLHKSHIIAPEFKIVMDTLIDSGQVETRQTFSKETGKTIICYTLIV